MSEYETFDLDSVYRSIGFDFSKFWSGENVGISQNESMTSTLTALEIRIFRYAGCFYFCVNLWVGRSLINLCYQMSSLSQRVTPGVVDIW